MPLSNIILKFWVDESVTLLWGSLPEPSMTNLCSHCTESLCTFTMLALRYKMVHLIFINTYLMTSTCIWCKMDNCRVCMWVCVCECVIECMSTGCLSIDSEIRYRSAKSKVWKAREILKKREALLFVCWFLFNFFITKHR